MKKTAKKLTLAKETVRTLADQELVDAQGGAIYTTGQGGTTTGTGVIADSRRIC